MDTLPDEMLEMVFQYVSTPELIAVCAQVSLRWKEVVERRAMLMRENSDFKRVHGGLRYVMVTTFPTNISMMVQTFTSMMQFLRAITAHSLTPLAREDMDALRLLPQLEHLDVFTRPRILDLRVAMVARRLRTFVANDNFTPSFLCSMAAGCSLTSLHMYGRASRFQPSAMVALLRARAVHLLDLTLRCGDMVADDYEVIGDCVNLRYLRLYTCSKLTAEHVRVVCRPRGLRLLHMTGARRIREAPLGEMLDKLPSCLEELALSMTVFNSKHVSVVIQRLPELRVLELWNCPLSKGGLLKLAMSLPRLEQLDVDLELSNRRLRELAQHPKLRWVRCMPDYEESGFDYRSMRTWEVEGLRVVASDTPIYHQYLRAEDETDSYRAALFYFWTRDVQLPPLSRDQDDGAELYSDCFYSPS